MVAAPHDVKGQTPYAFVTLKVVRTFLLFLSCTCVPTFGKFRTYRYLTKVTYGVYTETRPWITVDLGASASEVQNADRESASLCTQVVVEFTYSMHCLVSVVQPYVTYLPTLLLTRCQTAPPLLSTYLLTQCVSIEYKAHSCATFLCTVCVQH